MENNSYITAVLLNDEAHQKTLREYAERGELTQETAEQIAEEAKMWLREIFKNHYRR